MVRQLSPRYGRQRYHVLTTTWMCNIRLQAPTLAKKCHISHWFSCGADRRAGGRVGGRTVT